MYMCLSKAKLSIFFISTALQTCQKLRASITNYDIQMSHTLTSACVNENKAGAQPVKMEWLTTWKGSWGMTQFVPLLLAMATIKKTSAAPIVLPRKG